jgi:hypothetical protein
MSPDEWIHRGLEFPWKAWECRSEDRGGGGAGGDSKELADELRWLDLAIDCFSKAGSTETESNGIKLVAACIKEGMWLDSHLLASLLPLKSVTNLDYGMHLLRQWILNPLEAGDA